MVDKEYLISILRDLRDQLPIQNPMPFFVHNNPLQFWERYNFDEGIEKSCLLYERSGVHYDRPLLREFEDIVIPVLSSYLDQGLRHWEVSGIETLWDWFTQFVKSSKKYKTENFYKLKEKSVLLNKKTSEEVILELLQTRLASKEEWPFYIKSLLFHFKGWSGIVNLFEKNQKLFPLKSKNVSLLDWLAILMMVECNIVSGDDAETFETEFALNSDKRQFRKVEIKELLQQIKQQESSYYNTVYTSLTKHFNNLKSVPSPQVPLKQQKIPSAQVFFCIDDREESFRRILEEVNPTIETFGTVGFFGVDVEIKSFDQLIYQPYCPPVIQPRKKVVEKIKDGKNTNRFQKYLVIFNHTRFSLIEPIASLFAPLFYFFSLLLRTSHLELYSKIKHTILNPPQKELDFEYEFVDQPEFTIYEKSKIVLNILKSAGLKKDFAPIVVMMAHGSSTSNNPFQKSYGCGACSGQSGLPNAKIFCSFANDPAVRKELASQGYSIPEDTRFLAGHHDTCSDQFLIAEDWLHSSSMSHSQSLTSQLNVQLTEMQQQCLEKLKSSLELALKRNTQIRFQKFNMDPQESPLLRSQDWSQPRPEYGHSKVALAFFGPRFLTQGIDFDRRAFLVSYDPESDSDGSELEYVIMNALPVCANINLDYFTSSAFPNAFGSGSKLPMNIVSGIGMMTGSKSDLRIGLARQMVDQHEPLRLLAFVFCYENHLNEVILKSMRLTQLIKNDWIHLIRIDPEDYSMNPVTSEISTLITEE